MAIIALSSSRLLGLSVHHPNWRLYTVLRCGSIFLSFLTLLSFGVVIDWNGRELNGVHGWNWASWDIQWCLFVPGLLAWLWAVTTLSKLLITTKPFPPATDILMDLTVCVVDILAIAFALSVSGPMQWYLDGMSSFSQVVNAGSWEITGVVASIILFILHMCLFIWAWRLEFSRQRKSSEPETLKGPMAMRKATPDEEALWYSTESRPSSRSKASKKLPHFEFVPSSGPDGVVLPPEASPGAKHPVCDSDPMRRAATLGNSWECGSENRF